MSQPRPSIDEATFLASEYLELWRSHGVEPVFSEAEISRYRQQPAPAPRVVSLTPLDGVRRDLGDCRRCGLCAARNRLVFGGGQPKSPLLFLGEAPGEDEDLQGVPYVGPAGQLLNKIIEAMGLTRDRVYVTSLVKCRPPGNRAPSGDEIDTCFPFLSRQIAAVNPRVIVTLGEAATARLLGATGPLSTLRGRFHRWPEQPEIEIMATYGPELLLREASLKRDVWEDMKKVKSKLELS